MSFPCYQTINSATPSIAGTSIYSLANEQLKKPTNLQVKRVLQVLSLLSFMKRVLGNGLRNINWRHRYLKESIDFSAGYIYSV